MGEPKESYGQIVSMGGGGGEARLHAPLMETKHSEMATLFLVNAVKIRYFVGNRTALGSTGWAQFVCNTLFCNV